MAFHEQFSLKSAINQLLYNNLDQGPVRFFYAGVNGLAKLKSSWMETIHLDEGNSFNPCQLTQKWPSVNLLRY